MALTAKQRKALNKFTKKHVLKQRAKAPVKSWKSNAVYMRSARNPLPESQTVTLRYVENIDLAPGGAGAPAKYVWRCNGPYDPNQTGVGHQPMFWDLYAGLYNHCVVLGSKIQAKVWTETANTTYGSTVGIKLDDDASTTANIMTIMELKDPYFKYAFLRTNAGGETSSANISQSYSAKEFFGLTDVKDAKYTIGSLTNTTPTEQAYWILHWQHVDGSTTFTSNLKGYVVIDYICQFSEAKDQSSN